MIAMTLGEIASAVDGTVSAGDEDALVTAPAFIDSRSPVPGGLFAALPGEHLDGHQYAAAAYAGGAAGVLAARPVDAPYVVVPDVLAALATLARHVLSRARDLTVIGITGSQGKTSAKDMLAQVLARAGGTVAPAESLNNEIGVPLTALRVTPDTQYLVSEMGARGPGHIAFLAGIVSPRVGAVLNVGVAHLGEFGSRDNIAQAKGELVEALPSEGLAVLNADDARVMSMAARTTAGVLTFGTSDSADVGLHDVGLDDAGRVSFALRWRGDTEQVAMQYVGEHQAMNAAAAATVALGLDLPLVDVAASLRDAVPLSKWRMALTTRPDGVVVINDCYNANPDSMRAAVRSLVEIGRRHGGARTVAVLGEMRELGDTSRSEHQALGNLVAANGVSLLVTVGNLALPVHEGASACSSWTGTPLHARDPEQALALLRRELRRGDVVLVKASRAAGLEGLATALERGDEQATDRDGGA